MKLFDNKMLMLFLILFSGAVYIVGCTHKNEPLPAHASTGIIINHGNHVYLPGILANGDTTTWKFDKVHSNVMWATPFNAVGALLTGRFNQFGIADVSPAQMINYVTNKQPFKDTSWAFYENAPAKTHFSGYVEINQVNTGEPGRDGGCLVSTFGTSAIVPGTHNLTATNIALIKTTKVEFDPLSNAYLVTFNFTWQGKLAQPLTESIVGKLTYIPRAQVPGATYSEFGLEFQFQFNCRDFGIAATDIADNITINIDANFDNK
jgi:polyisoprenoid-binding protein YceI